jgi:inosine-uridine nucleoside N-ribohydrolase
MKTKPVILDTDIGSDIDDTWALIALLQSPELDCRLITTETGDTRYRSTIVARLLEIAGRTDIPIGTGIYQGPMEDRHRHQDPWVEDYDTAVYPGKIDANGVDLLVRTIRDSEEPVTLIGIGPCPNIADALDKDPSIAAKCHFVGMYGSIHSGYSEDALPEPETNVRVDVPAFRKVLAADWLSIKITPLDTCGRVFIDGQRFQRIQRSSNPLVRAGLENYRIWAKRVNWMTVEFQEERTSILFDNVAVFMAYSSDYLHFEKLPLGCTDEGVTVIDPDGPSVDVAISWDDRDGFLDHITERILGNSPTRGH